jgi:hypothetical protein
VSHVDAVAPVKLPVDTVLLMKQVEVTREVEEHRKDLPGSARLRPPLLERDTLLEDNKRREDKAGRGPVEALFIRERPVAAGHHCAVRNRVVHGIVQPEVLCIGEEFCTEGVVAIGVVALLDNRTAASCTASLEVVGVGKPEFAGLRDNAFKGGLDVVESATRGSLLLCRPWRSRLWC